MLEPKWTSKMMDGEKSQNAIRLSPIVKIHLAVVVYMILRADVSLSSPAKRSIYSCLSRPNNRCMCNIPCGWHILFSISS